MKKWIDEHGLRAFLQGVFILTTAFCCLFTLSFYQGNNNSAWRTTTLNLNYI
jgi:hypothetical protein